MTISPAAAVTAHPRLLDWLTLGGLVVAWGSSFAMTKIAVGHLDAAWVMALRLAIGGVFLLVVLYASGRKLPFEPGLWRWFAWLGLIGHALPFFLISWGTQFVSSGLSGVLMGAIPLFVIVAAHFFLPDEPMTRAKGAGFIVGFVGLMIVLGPDRLSAFSVESDALKGELAILLGCICYTVHGLFARRIPFHSPAEQATAVCLAAGLMGLAFAVAVDPSGLKDVPWVAFAAVIGLGILPTALATLMMYRIMRTVGVSFVAYSNYLVPVYALGFGALTLGETLDWNVAAGLVLIILGIAASRLAPSRLKGKT
ncbi:MAG: DMT family transporter [Rhizobiales bacterium]|nr:DMT family transporter [Hyphomicrobiales bacterium]